MSDFELAKDKVYMGTERRSMVISDEEKRTTAVHEAGHTLISVLITHHDPVHKVTIIPRGPALGVTWYLPKDDRHNLSKEQAESSIAVALGGRIAEEIMFGQHDDRRRERHREGDRDRPQDGVRVGHEREARSARVRQEGRVESSSAATRRSARRTTPSTPPQEIDQEVRGIVQRQYIKVKDLLTSNRENLQRLSDSLIERETLDAEEIHAVLEGRELPKREKVIIPTYAEKDKASKEKRRVASIFGGPPKPATSGS